MAEAMADEVPPAEEGDPKPQVTYMDIITGFLPLGWSAFGGPAASVGLFQKTFVERRGWISNEVFTELFAVCQCLPGPGAAQMSFAIGTTKKGIPGGLLSGMLFLHPGALLMTIAGLTAHGWASSTVVRDHAWLAGLVGGLAAAGVALVASAAVRLWNKACTAPDTKVLGGLCCVVTIYYCSEFLTPSAADGRRWMWIFPALLAMGGSATFFWRGPLPQEESAKSAPDSGIEGFGAPPLVGVLLMLVILGVFIASYALVDVVPYEQSRYLHWFSAFWRTGTMVWGGGQVVLPLLATEVVSSGWVEDSVFYAGLALAQAMPGPLFNFAAYLGAVMGYSCFTSIGGGIAAAAICWVGLFGPGVMLLFGILPFWGRFRKNTVYKRALPGLNASAVGLLIASLVQMAAAVRGANTKPTGPIPREASTCIGLIAFWAVHWLKLEHKVLTALQSPLVLIAGGLAGIVAGVLRMK